MLTIIISSYVASYIVAYIVLKRTVIADKSYPTLGIKGDWTTFDRGTVLILSIFGPFSIIGGLIMRWIIYSCNKPEKKAKW